jgi:hypothetical protein
MNIVNVSIGIKGKAKGEGKFAATIRGLTAAKLVSGNIVGPAVELEGDKDAVAFRNAGKATGIPVAVRKGNGKTYGFRMDFPLERGGRSYAYGVPGAPNAEQAAEIRARGDETAPEAVEAVEAVETAETVEA